MKSIIEKQDFIKSIQETSNGEYEVIGEYKNLFSPILLRHNVHTCKHEFSISPYDFLINEIRCPNCCSFHNRNILVEKIYKMIKCDYKNKIITNDIDLLGYNNKIDIYLPDINLAFQINDNYCNSDESQDCNYEKTVQCSNKGVRLIHFYMDELELIEHKKATHKFDKVRIFSRYIKGLISNNDIFNSVGYDSFISNFNCSKAKLKSMIQKSNKTYFDDQKHKYKYLSITKKEYINNLFVVCMFSYYIEDRCAIITNYCETKENTTININYLNYIVNYFIKEKYCRAVYFVNDNKTGLLRNNPNFIYSYTIPPSLYYVKQDGTRIPKSEFDDYYNLKEYKKLFDCGRDLYLIKS